MLKIDPSDHNAIIEAALRQVREAALSLPYDVQIKVSTRNADRPTRSTCSIYAGPNHQLHGCICLEQVPFFLAGLKAAEEPYIRAAGHPGGARKADPSRSPGGCREEVGVERGEMGLQGETAPRFLRGLAALEWAEGHGKALWKHADPTEGGTLVSPDEAREIAREDPALLAICPEEPGLPPWEAAS